MSCQLIAFNDKALTVEQVQSYYRVTQGALVTKSKLGRKAKYQTTSERMLQLNKAQSELSLEAGFMLLSYIESIFRIDLALRLQNRKWKDSLTQFYHSKHKPSEKIYKFPLELIFEGWKNWSDQSNEDVVDIMRKLPQYFYYRHWVAHGRYWVPKDTGYLKRYNYNAISLLVSEIESTFAGKLKTLNK